MYARVVTVHIKRETFDEAIAIYRDSIVPTAQQQRGNVSMMLLGDDVTGKVQSISLWETEADERTSAVSGYLQQQFAKLSTLMVAPPTHEAYEVWVKT